ncbi:MAG TPA: adenylate/guanylate cyclase domain-containing protein [Azospira sp.]|nr:adenylate/guanylate cyclase domain-containing protein [Azospira sp.]
MNRKPRYRWKWLLPLLPVAIAIALQLGGGGLQATLRNHLFDQYQRWLPRAYEEAPVLVVDIDDASLARLGQWPWPRTRIAELVDRLTAAGVAAIGFDVMFAEPDRTTPRAMVELWQASGALRRQIEALPDHDEVLAASLAKADTVLGFAVERTANAAAEARTPRVKAAFVHLGEPQTGWLHGFAGAVASLPALEAASKGNGALTFIPDGDGVVRRVPLVLKLAGQPVPTLLSEALRVAQGGPPVTLRSAGHINGFTGGRDNGGLGEIRIGALQIPTTAHGELWLHYTPRLPQRSLPAWRIFNGEVPTEALAGKIVLVGSSAQGLMDLRFNPFGLIPGVEAHAQALEQILTGRFLDRPSWMPATELALLVGGGVAASLLALWLRAALAALACAALLAALAGASWYAFAAHGLLMDAAVPAIGILLGFVASSLIHHLISEREQHWIREAFSRYVSPNRVSHLVDHPEAMELGGRRQECSFIFTDLAGFTTLMETIDPAQAVALLNDYLDEMIAIAFRHEGTLDRIVGDAVAILFSAPLTQPDHRQRALACALEMDAFAERYAGELLAKGIAFGSTRIGVHSGEVIVGNFGGKNIFDYRALGDPINTASRLESVNKHLGTRICVSESIVAANPHLDQRPVGRLVLKGKSQPLGVFEPVVADASGRAPLAAYLAAYAAMASEAETAPALFDALADDYPDDPLVKLHRRRLQAGERGDLIVMAEK